MPADPSIQRKLWRACAVLVLAIPGLWHVLSLPPTLGQVLRLPMLEWLNLPWLTSLTLLALLGHRFGWWPPHAAQSLPSEPESADADARVRSFSMAYRMLPDAAGITRIADGQFLDVNPAFCELLGLEYAEVVGRTNYELQIYASDAERPRLLQQLQLHQSVDRMPIAIQTARRSGAVHGLVSARTMTLGDEPCMMFVFHDTTEQTQTHQALQAVNGLLQQAGHLALLGVWEDTKGAGLVYWSDVCYDIHGLARDTPLPRSYIQTFVAPPWRSVMRDKIKQCLRSKSSWDAEIEIIRADGRTAWMRSRGEAVLNAEGEVTGLRGIMQDVDAAKRLQESLRQSEVRFEHIFEMVSTPMALVGCQDGRFQTVNTAWEALFGFSRYECAGQTAAGLGLTTASGPQAMLQAASCEDAALLDQELLLRTRQGQPITVLYSQRRTHFGDTDLWLISIQDITAHKAEQERLKESEALISLTLSAAALGRWDWNLATGMISGDAQWRSLQGVESDCAPPQHGWSPGTPLESAALARRSAAHLRSAAAPHRKPFARGV